MATIIRERVVDRPVDYHYHQGDGSSSGIWAAVIIIVVLLLLFWFGLPVLRSAFSGPTISVPKSVDVNINKK